MGSASDTSCNETSKEQEQKSVLSKKHTCPYIACNFAFDRPWKLDRHLNTHTNQRPFKCDHPKCTKAYTNNSHLQRHKSISHGNNKPAPLNIPCSFPECKKVFANKWSLKRHCASHYMSDPHKCVVCGEGFKKYWELKYHMHAHLGLDPFICELCKESFKTRPELKKHERTHKVYDCKHDGCEEKFSTWNGVRAHMKLVHPDRYTCDACGHLFKNKWILTEHVLSHLPFDKRDVIMCPYKDCERYYFYERNLEAHIRSYHHDINHKCDFEGCEKMFTTKRRLRDHQKVHAEPEEKKEKIIKTKTARKPRKDKGVRKKSMVGLLSGIVLPKHIDDSLLQSNSTSEVLEYIEKVKNSLSEKDFVENDLIVKKGSSCET